MKTSLTFLALLAVLGGPAAGQKSEVAAGRSLYLQGEFRKAARQLQQSLDANPRDAEAYYWIAMSYQRLADIAFPFGGKSYSKARAYLTRAVELDPASRDYRLELFDFLLDPAAWSRSSRRQAFCLLQATPESDADYTYMRQRLATELKASSSAEDRMGRAISAIPAHGSAVARIPAAVLHRPCQAARQSQYPQVSENPPEYSKCK